LRFRNTPDILCEIEHKQLQTGGRDDSRKLTYQQPVESYPRLWSFDAMPPFILKFPDPVTNRSLRSILESGASH